MCISGVYSTATPCVWRDTTSVALVIHSAVWEDWGSGYLSSLAWSLLPCTTPPSYIPLYIANFWTLFWCGKSLDILTKKRYVNSVRLLKDLFCKLSGVESEFNEPRFNLHFADMNKKIWRVLLSFGLVMKKYRRLEEYLRLEAHKDGQSFEN